MYGYACEIALKIFKQFYGMPQDKQPQILPRVNERHPKMTVETERVNTPSSSIIPPTRKDDTCAGLKPKRSLFLDSTLYKASDYNDSSRTVNKELKPLLSNQTASSSRAALFAAKINNALHNNEDGDFSDSEESFVYEDNRRNSINSLRSNPHVERHARKVSEDLSKHHAPLTTVRENQLRNVTSRLFDQNGTRPRRYSELSEDPEQLDDILDRNAGKNNVYGSLDDRPKTTSPHDYVPKGSRTLRQLRAAGIIFLLIFLLFFTGFSVGFLLATTKELQNFRINQVKDVIVSQEELVFNMVVEGFNPGFLNIEVTGVDLDFFAKTQYLEDTGGETVLLSNMHELPAPLVFHGGFFTRQRDFVSCEVKVVDPCSVGNNSRHELWNNISTYPFDLLVRGSFSYQMPLSGGVRAIPVAHLTQIEPNA